MEISNILNAEDIQRIGNVNDAYSLISVPFMIGDYLPPNEKYRPWLEEHIGKQMIDWDWVLSYSNSNIINIYFAQKEHAFLFKLRWACV